jgi:RND family efflux transporter MFP subunit
MHSEEHKPKELLPTLEPKASNPASSARFKVVSGVVMMLIVIGVVAGVFPRLNQKAELAADTRQLAIPVVTVASPKFGQPSSGLPLPAEIKPWIETPIYARSNGYLKRRLLDIGDRVEAGQLLLEIDTPELDQELERSRAQLAQAEAALELSRITSFRWAGLAKNRVVSDQENEEKQADFKLKGAATDSARAEVRRLEHLKSFSRVTAPFAGTITVRNIDEGDLIVAAGNRELLHLAQPQKLRVFVRVPQVIARSIAPGQNADVNFAELPGRVFTAEVVRTAGAIEADSRTLLVELNMNNPKDELLAGSYSQVRFTEPKEETVPTLPSNTILFRAEGPQIGVVHPDGTVETRKVKLGRDFGQTIEILTGVDSKDRVIVNPTDSLASGTTVSINETTKMRKGE